MKPRLAVNTGRRWHVVHAHALGRTACGADYFEAVHSMWPAHEVPEDRRCAASGCRAAWPPWLRLVAGGA